MCIYVCIVFVYMYSQPICKRVDGWERKRDVHNLHIYVAINIQMEMLDFCCEKSHI